MDTKSEKYNLTIRDFKEEDGRFVYKCGDKLIIFYETYGATGKMYIQVWYVEESKRYLKDEKTIKRNFGNNKLAIKESNRLMWYWINKFKQMYCHGE